MTGIRCNWFAGQPLETFTREANDIIQQNLLFFTLLNVEVRVKMFAVLEKALFPSERQTGEIAR